MGEKVEFQWNCSYFLHVTVIALYLYSMTYVPIGQCDDTP